MDSMDKKIKEAYFSTEDQLPDGYSWEEMENGILSKMPEEKKDRKVFFWLFGFVLLALIGAAAWSWQNTQQEKTEKIITYQEESNADHEKYSEKNNNSTNEFESKSLNIEQTEKDIEKKNAEIKSYANTASIQSTKRIINHRQSLTANTTTNKPKPAIPALNKSEKSWTSSSNTNTQSSSEQTPHLSGGYQLLEQMVELDKLKLNCNTLLHRGITAPSIQSIKKESSQKWALLAGSSIHNGLSHNPESQKYTEAAPGFSLALNYQKNWKQNWILGGQIMYSFMVDQLDFSKTDQIDHTYHNSTITATNTLTGSSQTVTGDITQTVDRYRKEYHSNTYHMAKIEVGIGREWQVAPRLLIHAMPTLGYAFTKADQVVALDEFGEVIRPQKTLIRNHNFTIGGRIGIDVAITDRWSLSAQLQGQSHLKNIAIDSPYKFKSLGLYAGLSQRF